MAKNKKHFFIHNGKTPVDHMVYIGLISPIMTLPQLYSIWFGNSDGVSLITWLTYLLVSFVWLSYGLKHKLKPLIVVMICWIVIDTLLVLGLLVR